jgi:RNA polymerase sigma-70 factor (ECF subfamily)
MAASDGGPPDVPLESTAQLIQRIRGGDAGARELLVARFLPLLQRWAHGRLPRAARGLSETDDLVQVTLIRAIQHIDGFRSEREGALLAYLRRTLLNELRDEIRRSVRRPSGGAPADLPDRSPTLLDEIIGRETIEAYEAALAALPETHQEAVILRLEFGYSYPQIAEATGSPSSNAARMTVSRALLRLSEEMERHR